MIDTWLPGTGDRLVLVAALGAPLNQTVVTGLTPPTPFLHCIAAALGAIVKGKGVAGGTFAGWPVEVAAVRRLGSYRDTEDLCLVW